MLLYTQNNSKFAYSLEENEFKDSNLDKDFNGKNNYALLGVPFDSTSTYKVGSRYGPLVIREASHNFERYNLTFDKNLDLPFYDLGDVEIVPGNLIKTCCNIESTVKKLKDHNLTPIFLGGEHSITYPILKAINAEDVTVIHFDAHMDMIDRYMGEKYSHATVMRRVYDLNPLEIIQIGIRSCSREEKIFVDKKNIKYYSSKDVYSDIKKIIETIDGIDSKIYVSIDIDVLDPSFAPNSGNPMPGGIDPFQMEILISKIAEKEILGLDLVEVASNQLGDVTAINAAKIIYDFLCLKS
ncbi:MAG: agmatinase [Methanobacteriaceae archaeon]|nr:agmatinase [Methanobacteriaceae archaeon]